MFATTIIDSDAFIDMPTSARLLYYDLGMRADDDGFINNPKKIQRMIGSSEDDLKLLMAKNFIIPFESGVVVIKHWKIHNYIRTDRYKPTVYKEEMERLEVKENNSYRLKNNSGMSLGIPNVNQMETQVRLGKVSIGKDSKDKDTLNSFASLINSYTNKSELRETLKTYKDMRMKMSKGFSINAMKLILNKLSKLATDDDTKIAIVNQSIENTWKGLFELKGKPKKQSNEQSNADILKEIFND
ncbi:MAG: phage replication initiation protein [Bacilli bacterium]|nr:phage replication initiation protein [Bacilli bacterium]